MTFVTSLHHKFSKYIRPNFLIKTLKWTDLDSHLANWQIQLTLEF